MKEGDFLFRTTVRVRYADTDAQGHVYFANYLVYFDIGTTDYMKAIGYSYEKLLEDGYDFFTVEALCRYRGEAFFDDELDVGAKISNIGNSSFTFNLALFRGNILIADGHIVNVMIDRSSKKPVRVPEGFRKAVEEFEQRR
ncbi:MAG: thioesterase family protein [Thermodesulforhabdaceae bacterium]